jgi:predicted TIM-barrel fold metal-dependent hydrolase
MVIDGHAHSSGIFRRPETLIRTLDELEVDRVALCQNIRNDDRDRLLPFEKGEITRHPAVSYTGNLFLRAGGRLLRAEKGRIERNREVLALAEKCRGRVIPFYWANPGRPDALKENAGAIERDGFRGIKLHQCINPFPIDSPAVAELAALAAERGAPVFIHFYSPSEVRKFKDVALAHPRTVFIIAHLIGLEILAPSAPELRNVYWDISPAWGSPASRVRVAVDSFGADRVMLGSDTPFGRGTLKRNIIKIRGMDLPDSAKALILGGNAARLLKLN